jgi:hypothetical protein
VECKISDKFRNFLKFPRIFVFTVSHGIKLAGATVYKKAKNWKGMKKVLFSQKVLIPVLLPALSLGKFSVLQNNKVQFCYVVGILLAHRTRRSSGASHMYWPHLKGQCHEIVVKMSPWDSSLHPRM